MLIMYVWRFVIFWFLFGTNRKSHRSRSPLRSLFNLQFVLENKSKIWQSELIEPTTKESVSLKATSLLGERSPRGTLLMSFKLTVGRTAVLDIDAYHNEAIISIWPFLDSNSLQPYLFYTLPVLANLGDSNLSFARFCTKKSRPAA